MTETGWPYHVNDINIKHFELTCEERCMKWGKQVTVPSGLQHEVLKELLAELPGIVKMKMLAHSMVWWPNTEDDVQRKVETCEALRNDIPTVAWPETVEVWERIHIDLLQHRRWIEVWAIQTITAASVIEKSHECLATFGISSTLVSDNGPPFNS
ncbi:hypothetical protein PR048_032995 [Dryococelus australis]|uniref:Integrase catalytic domain-containing protein n=1 Tax=Dryococelus australis TaxID=614101 RepID=A0ABQ9G6M2_9NEOP|nr:hypothetical protein PR048_032995 [Dryococelus australis]